MSKRTTQLDEVGRLDAAPGSREWCIAVKREAGASITRVECDAKTAGDWLRALREHDAWKTLGELSWSMLLDDLGITEEQADNLMKAATGETVGAVLEIGKHGGDRKSEQSQNQVDNINLKHNGGTGESYTLARLKRDNPELLARVEAGELSGNAAAIEAGWRKKQLSVPIGAAQSVAKSLLKHYTMMDLLAALWEEGDETQRAVITNFVIEKEQIAPD